MSCIYPLRTRLMMYKFAGSAGNVTKEGGGT